MKNMVVRLEIGPKNSTWTESIDCSFKTVLKHTFDGFRTNGGSTEKTFKARQPLTTHEANVGLNMSANTS